MDETGVRATVRERAMRAVVAQQVEQRWEGFAEAHPHLAAAIDRMRLVEATVRKLDEDPAFVRAMEAAGRDEAALAAAMDVVGKVGAVVERMLGR